MHDPRTSSLPATAAAPPAAAERPTGALLKHRWLSSAVLLALIVGAALLLALWKRGAIQAADAAAASQPEPVETVTVVTARERQHARTTTSIGTVMALRSITLRNELAGMVQEVALTPGQIVEAGTVLVALDVSVEEAELKAQEAQAALAETILGRMERASQSKGASEMDVDRARAERDIALAQVARTKAIIARKTVRAPFRAHVGLSNVHPGQYLNEGTELTTLQGVDEAVDVDFTVAQHVAAGLREGDRVDVYAAAGAEAVPATIVAVDARVDPTTRNATVRARLAGFAAAPAPGASVRVLVPVGEPRTAVAVPVSALRKGPSGDHVFVISPDEGGKLRAHLRPVVSGAVLGDEALIEAGLAAGEQVAASGSFKLHESVLVAVASEPEADGSAGR